ncbi:MAG: endonuclease [Leptospiraceae bacterium]|nr:endonuclease [Leptospiraceae bacterium]
MKIRLQRTSIFWLVISISLLSYCSNTEAEKTEYKLAAASSSNIINSSEHGGYYNGIDTSLNNADFKAALQSRLKNHRQIPYTENSSAFPSYFTKAYITLLNAGENIPARFDIWDAYTVFASKAANPYSSGSNCASNRLLDWYDLRCYDTPSEIMSQSSGGQQDTGAADTLAAPEARFGSQGQYNREHAWPKSWFLGSSATTYCANDKNDITGEGTSTYDYRAYVDLHHLIPARRSINTARSNFSFGVVATPDTHFPRNNGVETGGASFGTPNAGSMSGFPGATGVTNKVFEPPTELKGDIARIYFYMASRYYREDDCWLSNNAVSRANINTWLENLLRTWHTNDPVSDAERTRNNWIFRIQGNRNPFIDYPDWVSKIADF